MLSASFFFTVPDMNPRTLWTCQFVACASSFTVAPISLPSSCRIFDDFVPGNLVAFFATLGKCEAFVFCGCFTDGNFLADIVMGVSLAAEPTIGLPPPKARSLRAIVRSQLTSSKSVSSCPTPMLPLQGKSSHNFTLIKQNLARFPWNIMSVLVQVSPTPA